MKQIILSGILLIFSSAFSQTNLKVSFRPCNGGVPLEFNTVVSNITGEKVSITNLYYYISNIHVIHDGGQDLDLSDTVIIVKNDNFLFDFGVQNVTNVEQINFGVGVPQALNHLDISTYPVDHPLSYQSPSMQWGWTSGYNQVGIIGIVDDNGDNVPNKAFEFFSLSDMLYRSIQLPITSLMINEANQISIQTNIDQWYKGINLATNGILHGSSGNNVTLMNNTQNYPVFIAEANAGIQNVKLEEGKLFYTTSNNTLDVNWSEFQNASHYELINIGGAKLNSGTITSNNGLVQISNISTGNYWFIVYSKDGNQLNKLRIIK
ncbi:MAG: hypothetical protein HYR91_12350 [Flavobacteriia bacterium]|nr:hypothetical protein [Flavobacteriia bacterium]